MSAGTHVCFCCVVLRAHRSIISECLPSTEFKSGTCLRRDLSYCELLCFNLLEGDFGTDLNSLRNCLEDVLKELSQSSAALHRTFIELVQNRIPWNVPQMDTGHSTQCFWLQINLYDTTWLNRALFQECAWFCNIHKLNEHLVVGRVAV